MSNPSIKKYNFTILDRTPESLIILDTHSFQKQLWKMLSIKYPFCEMIHGMSSLWNVLSMIKCPVYDERSCKGMSYIWNVLWIPVLRLGWLLPISTFLWDLAQFYQSYPGTVSKQTVDSQPKPATQNFWMRFNFNRSKLLLQVYVSAYFKPSQCFKNQLELRDQNLWIGRVAELPTAMPVQILNCRFKFSLA